MKKSLLALAVLGAFSGIAAAQSSVTVFGVVDVAVSNVENGDDDMTTMRPDAYNNGRLGFRGVEDLGGGLKAGFWLESSVLADNGTANATKFWSRRSTVSLMGGFGEVRLGRDFTPTYTSWADYAIFGTNGSAGSNIFNDNVIGSGAATVTRADNMVSYILPTGLGGLTGQLSVAAGEAVAGNKYVGGRIGYAIGGFSGQLGYGETDVVAVGGDDKYTRWTAGASYDFGFLKLLGYYIQSEVGPNESKVWELGASIPVGAGIIRLSYAEIDVSSSGTGATAALNDDDATKFGIGYIHNLSKRTALYATLSFISNDNAAAPSASNMYAASGPGVGVPAFQSGGQDSRGIDIGIRHSF